MGFLSCNADSAISVCDPFNWDRKVSPKAHKSTSTAKCNTPIQIRHFAYSELVRATGAFSADAFLGKGSHGTVYRASLDNGKLTAAVKKTTSNQTVTADNEIEILSRIHHPRLVNLIGFCDHHPTQQTQLLVVEYMPNGSLYDFLHASPRPPGWTRRVRFALQVAKAVHALHSSNPPVIHRDIKSSNVLLDSEWSARLGDFGLALRGNVEDVRVKCTPPAGTLGYLDPGYLAPGDLSTKSDVFSYGILLLEIISGRNAIDVNFSPPSIVDWAVPLVKRGDYAAICDYRLAPPADPVVTRKLAVIAAKCVRSTAERRPGMAEVVEALKAVKKRIHAPVLWNELRRRVGEWKGKDGEGNGHEEGSEEVNVSVNKAVRVGGGRRNRKVSSVSSAEYGSETIRLVVGPGVGDRVIRSKSIGSYSEGGKVAVRMAVMRLSKSRSMGVLHSPHSTSKNKAFVFELGTKNDGSTRIKEGSLSNVYMGMDETSEMEAIGVAV